MTTKIERRVKIKYRVRNKISGTAERPRMSVFRNNKQIYVQIIDEDVYKRQVQIRIQVQKKIVNRVLMRKHQLWHLRLLLTLM